MTTAKKTTKAVRKNTQVDSIKEGEAMAQAYLRTLPEGHGWGSVEEFIYCYLAPMGIRRLEALARDKKKHDR